MKINRLGIGAAAGLMALSTYMALDTFAISNTYQNDATMMNMALFESLAEAREEFGTITQEDLDDAAEDAEEDEEASMDAIRMVAERSDEEKTIRIYEYRVSNTTVYVADVRLKSAEYLKTAFAGDSYGRNITATTSEIAEDNNALFAINGDYYGARERGYVIRNGVLYRNTAAGKDVLCIYADGHMETVADSDFTAEELLEKGVWQAFSFGPGLLEDGEVTVSYDDEVRRAMASNPRTAIGVMENNHYVFVVSDGRTGDNEGLSLYDLAEFMQSLGVKDAYNLDGGGSSTMVFEGELINNPSTGGKHSKERSVSDIVYIG